MRPAAVVKNRWAPASPASLRKLLKVVAAQLKKREEVHRMAEANKAFSHYRF